MVAGRAPAEKAGSRCCRWGNAASEAGLRWLARDALDDNGFYTCDTTPDIGRRSRRSTARAPTFRRRQSPPAHFVLLDSPAAAESMDG